MDGGLLLLCEEAPNARGMGCFARERARSTKRQRTVRERVKPPHETATYCTSLGEKAPPPGGAGGGRVALLAVRRRRNDPLGRFLFAKLFLLGLHGQKKKRR